MDQRWMKDLIYSTLDCAEVAMAQEVARGAFSCLSSLLSHYVSPLGLAPVVWLYEMWNARQYLVSRVQVYDHCQPYSMDLSTYTHLGCPVSGTSTRVAAVSDVDAWG